MPRTKRAVVEADSNAEVSIPKKSSKGKASSTETTVVNNAESNASNAENKNDASNPNPEPLLATSTISRDTGRLSATSVIEPLEFIVVCRPAWDIEVERFDKSDEEDDNEEDDENDYEEVKDIIYEAPDKDCPEWPWTITKEGLKKYKHLEKQATNDDEGYSYNNDTSYGVNEVVDNWLSNFNKEVSKRTVSPCAVWVQLEGFALFSQLDYIDIWFRESSHCIVFLSLLCTDLITDGNDCHAFAETIATVGKALLTGLHILKDHQLLKPYHPENGGLRNISTVLALFVQFVGKWVYIGGDHYGETKWVATLAELAKQNNIDIKGPYGFPRGERTQNLLEPDPAKEKKQKVRLSEGTWGRPYLIDASVEDEWDIKDDGDYSVKGWKRAFKTYMKGGPTGGTVRTY